MSSLRVSVIGTGYLGATHAAAMAELGFDATGVDVDPAEVELHLRGAQVSVYDPAAGQTGPRTFPTLSFAASPAAAVTGADVVLVLTEWPEFVDASPVAIADLARGRTVIDARNCPDTGAWRAAGGRSTRWAAPLPSTRGASSSPDGG